MLTDFGLEVLDTFMTRCKFPWLLSNVLDKCTGQPLAGARETYILDWDGIATVSIAHYVFIIIIL